MKKCVICGAEITGKYSNNRKYCSEACIRKHEATKYQDRITKRAKNINKVAHSVYRAYNSSCAICGWRATDELIISKGKIQYAHGNEIHHITPIAEGGKETADNIILLCPNHHKQADLGILSREELRKHTKTIDLSEEEIDQIKSKCADAIATLIFDS